MGLISIEFISLCTTHLFVNIIIIAFILRVIRVHAYNKIAKRSSCCMLAPILLFHVLNIQYKSTYISVDDFRFLH